MANSSLSNFHSQSRVGQGSPRPQGLSLPAIGEPEQMLHQARKLQQMILTSPKILPGDTRMIQEAAVIEGQAWQELMHRTLKEEALYTGRGTVPAPIPPPRLDVMA